MSNMNTSEMGVLQPDERLDFEAIVSQALHFDPQRTHWWIDKIGIEQCRVVRQAGQVVAGLGILPMRQWFNGQPVPVAGITAVGVRLDYRGRGVGKALLRQMLDEQHHNHVPLAALYPSSLSFYRKVGFERAGSRLSFEAPIHALALNERALPVRLADAADEPVLRALYTEYAQTSHGKLERAEFIWQRILHPHDATPLSFLIGSADAPQGYVVLSQGGRDQPLQIRDMCTLSKAAALRIQALLGGQRTMLERIAWNAAPNDPFMLLLPEHSARITRSFDWMLRIVDVVQALTSRGYPLGVAGTLQLDLQDEVLPWNHGRFVLDAAEGRATVQRGGSGAIRLSVRDLAALYTGFLTPAELSQVGTLTGDARSLALANMLFCSQRPALTDMI